MRSYIYSTAKAHKCPKCGNFDTRRSPRKGLLDRLLSLINIYPYRCQHYGCDRRFYRFGR